ncbi:MAG: hypothetical protein Q4B28_03300 [bacterium]|nr:hypothetical protein [bacterium]
MFLGFEDGFNTSEIEVFFVFSESFFYKFFSIGFLKRRGIVEGLEDCKFWNSYLETIFSNACFIGVAIKGCKEIFGFATIGFEESGFVKNNGFSSLFVRGDKEDFFWDGIGEECEFECFKSSDVSFA